MALNEFANLIENIVCHIPEKWNRQAFDLIVSSSLADFVLGTCIEAVKDTDLIDYSRVVLNLNVHAGSNQKVLSYHQKPF